MGNHWRASSKVYDERAEEYDSWFEESLLFDIEKEAIRSLPVSGQQPGLEIGVGPARFAQALSTNIGIDPAFAPLQIAKSRGINVCQAIGEELPFLDQSFAAISLYFTLCFVQEPAKVISECHRVLQDTARLTLGFVPATSQWGANLQQKKEDGHPFYEHATFLTIAEIETLLADQQFSITASASCLYQAPGQVTEMEAPQPGMDKSAGFIVLSATKLTT